MKTKRFFSVFLLIVLVMSLWAVPFAAADGTEKPVLPEEPDIQCKAALLVDANTGLAVYAKNEHQELYPASLTKIMTALLTLEAIDSGKLAMNQEITATASALSGLSDDGSSANIQAGETMTVENLLYCMLVVSANEACDILAEAVSGSVDAFVANMNEKAAELGCKNTHFVNPNGLHDSQHYTSAWDMYLITKEAMTHPDFMRICDTATYTVPATNLSDARTLHTTNYLIGAWWSRGYLNSDAHGIKTGSTSDAGHCLVSSATRGSLSFISVVLGGDRVTLENNEIRTYSFYDTNLLFNWAFDSFTYQTVMEGQREIREVPVSLSKIDHVLAVTAQDTEVLMPKVLKPDDLEQRVSLLQETVEAPVKSGQKLGTLDLVYDDTVYATVDLLAANDVEASRLLTFWRDVRLFFAKTSVRVALVVLAVLIAALIVWKLLFSRRRYRYGRSVGRSRGSSYRGRGRRR
ncbi:MAG: D-alanyl-D-alanine carboxypeptidase family protein [Oscillospiraceae bacterium]|nr:D-alanyl-D-alanine carboxypeptidase family protein [Oscillospiraceae bacterium]